MSAAHLAPNAPITLQEAAETLLRGLVTASTLRAAAERGELVTERLGRRIVTTPANIHEWRRRCRVSAEARTSTSSSAPTASRPGISAMADSGSQQDVTNAMLTALAERSKGTSERPRGRRSATVIPLASPSRP